MERYVVLLRGVNVGGNRSLPMATLRDGLTAAGCRDVVTYIQSGNVVLTIAEAAGDVQRWLAAVISDIAGFEVPVAARTAEDLARAISANPFPELGGTQLHVVFLQAPPSDAAAEALAEIDQAAFEPERFAIVGRDLYLALPNGMGKATLPTAVDRALRRAPHGERGTARNWNTVLKLLSLAGG